MPEPRRTGGYCIFYSCFLAMEPASHKHELCRDIPALAPKRHTVALRPTARYTRPLSNPKAPCFIVPATQFSDAYTDLNVHAQHISSRKTLCVHGVRTFATKPLSGVVHKRSDDDMANIVTKLVGKTDAEMAGKYGGVQRPLSF